MMYKSYFFLLLILLASINTAEAQKRDRRFRGKPVVVVKPRPGLRPARVVVTPRPRTLSRLPNTARRIVFRNTTYHVVNGVYYVPRRGNFVRIVPRPGLRVATLPASVFRFTLRGTAMIYFQGVYYRTVENGYEVIAPPLGATIPELPDDAEMVEIDGRIYYEHNKALYQLIQTPEGDAYEVIGQLDE
ncbi:DUF6515 family protein [Psychroflexus tropicus]|uniref:DUF6515 family protein n=1 Tax=Psychroflexus tropicus TaxID=197345 RepID=UPI000399B5BD|nr:DUF6515 family protein [Psychroflexus tropicus]